ncbi:uncharacterized protein LOC110275184 [Arachis duranensis]|uniref:Uncharacterized protein LOC110275184 n=1 Tax=Arachis duranensis TaxID=130453 RepID=A0A9C6TJV6_ARADU|nr:uncharacterized protein LOC110275184 [Arachis duranensis]
MFIISSFLAPTSSAVTSPKHLRAIVDVENITRYNWARFVHDELMKGVQKFKEKNTLSIDGCLYVFMIIYYHKDTFGDKENYMGPPPPWIAYWDKEKLAKKLTQESSKQRPTGIVTLLVKQGGVDTKFAKNTTRAPTKKRGAKELNKDNTTKEKKERFDEQNNDNKMSKEDDNVSDEQKDKESDAKQDDEKEVKTSYDCGLFVIKWVEMWNPSSIEINESNMPEWDEEAIGHPMLTSLSNALLKDVINKSEKYKMVKPTPAQSSPYIVCNTDELMIECLGSAGKGFRKKTVAKKRRN